MVASPRDQGYFPNREAAVLQRPLAVRGQRKYARERATQFDAQHLRAILFLRRQLDPINQAADDLCGFGAVVLIVQRLDQPRDLLPIELCQVRV